MSFTTTKPRAANVAATFFGDSCAATYGDMEQRLLSVELQTVTWRPSKFPGREQED